MSAKGVDERLLRRMGDAIVHRGPDDGAIWSDPDAGVGFAHRRLSIIDLSPQGRQPMHSADGRFVLVYNGEIYNHAELRHEIDARGDSPQGGWRGNSDTETLLQAIAAWGLERALEQSVGMFAFALWDRSDRTLSLVRDRFGEKPLYYGWAGSDLVFGSEIKALRLHPEFDSSISREALALYAARTYIPAPLSIHRRLFKLEPATIISFTLDAALRPLSEPPREGLSDGVRVKRYWSHRDIVRSGLDDPINDPGQALDAVEEALAIAVKGQSIADVPVGAFLSGGIDSSLIVALMQKTSAIPARTYTIGFEEAGFNEAEHARRIAEHLGTVHHEHYVTVGEAREAIPLLSSIYDEPFADSSQIPTYLVSKFARRHVKVALTGDGGDELFGGYNRHFAAPRLWNHLQKVPLSVRSLVGSALGRLPSRFWSTAVSMLAANGQPNLPGKLQKAFRVAASARDFDFVYASFLDEWSMEQSPVVGPGEGRFGRLDLDLGEDVPDSVRIMYCDSVSYLPDDILHKVDRASMATSLETRVPFLDHRVAAIAARVPIGMKIDGGTGKLILRRLLGRHVPEAFFERPKAGFAIPVGEWIKGPLRPWAEHLLDPQRLSEQGHFDPQIVRRRWDQHLSGVRESTPALWAILMFQAWLEENSGAITQAA